ncbi:MAG: type II toxin-antitoxin system RelB/DinJ family antitoxin [Deferribacterales bacterium]
MMRSATLQVRMPEELKKEANDILSALGLTASEAVNIFYSQIVLNNGIPFEIKLPNKETREAIEEARSGKSTKRFKNVDELFEDLNS